jgi:D-alanyl-D-alanine carboxypeptidase
MICLYLCLPAYVGKAAEPSLSAQSACMMDVDSGQVLFCKNERQKRPMASTTKIMTAIIALESGKLDDIVTIPVEATRIEGTKIYLKAGEKMHMRDLVTGLMLDSGNDAAYSIACFLGGNQENFAKMMTSKAEKIGATDTVFKNPHGLPEKGHYTTAYDLALITAYAMKNPEFARISALKSATASTCLDERTVYFRNHNKLLSLYDDAVGVKTGFTKEAGRCLVGAAQKNGLCVVTVTLNAPDDWNDHIKMFGYAFDTYEKRLVLEKGAFLKTIKVLNGDSEYVRLFSTKDLSVTVEKGDTQKTYIKYHVPKSIKAPVKKGQQIGSIDAYVGKVKAGSIALFSKTRVNYVEKGCFSKYFGAILKNWLRVL